VRQGKTLRKIGTDFFNSSGRPGTLSTASPLRQGGLWALRFYRCRSAAPSILWAHEGMKQSQSRSF
jgi:hypothetical protein